MIDLQPNLDLSSAEAERLLAAWLGEPVVCTDLRRMKGGMVNTVFELTFEAPPHRAVVKLHGSGGETFEREARALEYLAARTTCPVPQVYLHDATGLLIPHAFLLLQRMPGECLEGVDLDPDERASIDAQLAQVLGHLHEHTRTSFGGIDEEGTEQWADLFAQRLAAVRAQPTVGERLAPDVLARVDAAIDLARPALTDPGPPTLVHGDVWDGNLMAERSNGGWHVTGLFDPSLEFADVEYELAYLEVFDMPRDAFFAAYRTHHTVRPGYEERRLFYWLHTALVHVALFGDEFFCQFTERTAGEIVSAAGR